MNRLLFVSALLLAGCNPTISFDTTLKGAAQVPGSSVPTSVISLPIDLGLNNINIDQSANLKNSNTDKSHIDHARVKSLTLAVTNPTPGDISFLRTLKFSIAAPGQATKQIAHLETFPALPSAQMTVDVVDLAPYLKADSFSITAEGTGTAPRAPPQNTTLEATMVLTIDAHVL
jgi:hypothetical protein